MSEFKYISGLEHLKAEFARIPIDAGKKVLRKGASGGATVVRDAVQAAAPIGPLKRKGGHQPGTLKRSVLIKFKREDSNDNQAVFIVTFRKGKSAQGGLNRKGNVFRLSTDAYYAPWVERGHRIVPRASKFKGALTFGTSKTERRKGGSGSVPPHPFMEPAFNASRDTALAAMIGSMSDEMVKVLR